MIFRITFVSFAITCITSTYYTFRYLDKSSDFESLHSSVLPTSSLSPRPHLSTGTSQDFEGLCSSIASTLIDLNVQVNLAEYVPNGTNLTFPDNVSCFAIEHISHSLRKLSYCHMVRTLTVWILTELSPAAISAVLLYTSRRVIAQAYTWRCGSLAIGQAES